MEEGGFVDGGWTEIHRVHILYARFVQGQWNRVRGECKVSKGTGTHCDDQGDDLSWMLNLLFVNNPREENRSLNRLQIHSRLFSTQNNF